MGRRCPECRKVWPDHLWTCPRDGAKLGARLTTPPEARVETSDGDAQRAAGEAAPVQEPLRHSTPTLPADLQIGGTLGRYKLVSKLAEGGAATVFEAVHTTLDRPAAIKVLHPELIQRPLLVKRFFNEARSISQLRHPNIIEITDFVESGDHPPYIVMELLEGQDLRDHIVSHGPLEPEETARIAVQICDALQAAHKAGIVHRDLKAENIFLIKGPAGTPKAKLLDFGLAKWLSQDDPLLHTNTGEVVGTPEYMSPEQIRGEEVDARTDIYSLGVVMYEMLTNQVPFGRDRLGDLLRQQLSETPRMPSDWLKEKGHEPLPPGLDQVVLACLAKKPADRFLSMAALKDALEQCIEDTGVVTIPQPVRPGPSRRLWMAVGGAVLACAAALTVWGVLSRRKGETTPKHARPAAETDTRPATTEAPASVVLTSRPPRASVFRLNDGRFLGRTPIELVAGSAEKQRYALRLTGYAQTEITVEPGHKGPVRVVLKPVQPAGGNEDPVPADMQPGRPSSGGETAGRGPRPTRTGKTQGATVRKDGEWGVVDPFKTKGKPR